MTAPVSIENVSKTFGHFTALDRVSLDIRAGEFIVLLGPSGCGKTTLLSILGGFLSPSSGRVVIGDRDMTFVTPAKRPTTTMFQDYALFPHMRLVDNVGFGLRMRGLGKAERDEKALGFLDLVGLKASAGKRPHELSGGQRQRVALARALAVDPEVLLLDEPLGALDLKLRRQMQDELKAIQKRVGTTFVHVTHDQEEAMAIADRIVVMNQGRIEDFGPPSQIYMRPRSLFSAGFMGEVNFVPGRIKAADASSAEVETSLGNLALPAANFTARAPRAGDAITLTIRPEHFRGNDKSDGPMFALGDARVAGSAFFGTHYRCHLKPCATDGDALVAHLPQSSDVRDGEIVPLAVRAADVVALPAASGTL
ncbi:MULTISPECIES: ABC transporter ATP-binding protein [Ensifer]|jgi:spermidine/putrescine transport system ATP-binding protein|uniref:ATP-binding cassette domain-containing protein n=1 Tax=Ensifer canadensis TaxID=555315 RepID=A0AAW4FH91_9HYPH|nr:MULTISPECIES: ABC transporter ATP-binding protein [Ensifer]AHK45266.1 spermidine/putrescine ABC transporter, ATP-binding protein [Ensifer adhaerens OV14]MDP9633427.1 spermidine/putrescine transport system ATP-binding protein [Ensifer adhaerens]KQU91964.1 spermidine/putrescine ABC transporter ATP-binding protein [Ensifer sp. Root31]KQW60248.1 spermidine/putrescine ABC transporter ATP-binding protein [Ensifer sp. Root1252]KQW70261.1 spermidine/putrescine ABC transporter ATP-binding protein [E